MKVQKKVLALMLLFTGIMLCACGNDAADSALQQSRGVSAETIQNAPRAGNEKLLSESSLGDTEKVTEVGEQKKEKERYLIEKLDMTGETVSLIRLKDHRQQQYSYTLGTEFLDKYGDMTPAASFLPGTVINMEISLKTGKLTTLQMAGDVFVQSDIKVFSIDEEKKIITIGKTKYGYDENLFVVSDEKEIPLNNIAEGDILKVTGYDRQLLSVSVTTGHGTLSLSNTELFEDSFICIGDKIFAKVSKNMKIEVPEGDYLVSVANNGYGGSKEVTINRDADTELNLDELKGEGPKFCDITFEVGVEGTVIEIDGKAVDYSQPVKVQYGTHNLTAKADGYDPVSKKLVVNSKDAVIQIAMGENRSDTGNSANNSTDSNSGNNNSDNTNNNNTNNNNTNNNNTNSNNTNNNNTNSNNTNNNNSNNNNSNNNNTNNSNTNNNSNSNNSNNSNTTDYLTTLYNLLNTINGSGTGSGTSFDFGLDET